MPEHVGAGTRRARLHAELRHRNGRLLDECLLHGGVAHVVPRHPHGVLVAVAYIGLPVAILCVLVVSRLLERVLRHPSHTVTGHLAHLLLLLLLLLGSPVMIVIIAMGMVVVVVVILRLLLLMLVLLMRLMLELLRLLVLLRLGLCLLLLWLVLLLLLLLRLLWCLLRLLCAL